MAANPFVSDCLDLLSVLGPVRSRAMFGGHGIYHQDRMFALIAQDVLYLKVDDGNRSAFEAAGSRPFVWEAKDGRKIPMSYWEMPAEGFETPERTEYWAGLAVAAAQRARP
jgi:DNA transformation protein and related proteins